MDQNEGFFMRREISVRDDLICYSLEIMFRCGDPQMQMGKNTFICTIWIRLATLILISPDTISTLRVNMGKFW